MNKKFDILMLIAVLLLVSLAVWGLRSIAWNRIEKGLDAFVGALEKSIGLELEYKKAEPNFIKNLDVDGLSFYAGDAPLPVLTAGKTHISWSLLGLINEGYRNAVHTITLDDITINIDSAYNKEYERFFEWMSSGPPYGLFDNLLPRDCSINFTNLKFNFIDKDRRAEVKVESFHAAMRNDVFVFAANMGGNTSGINLSTKFSGIFHINSRHGFVSGSLPGASIVQNNATSSMSAKTWRLEFDEKTVQGSVPALAVDFGDDKTVVVSLQDIVAEFGEKGTEIKTENLLIKGNDKLKGITLNAGNVGVLLNKGDISFNTDIGINVTALQLVDESMAIPLPWKVSGHVDGTGNMQNSLLNLNADVKQLSVGNKDNGFVLNEFITRLGFSKEHNEISMRNKSGDLNASVFIDNRSQHAAVQFTKFHGENLFVTSSRRGISSLLRNLHADGNILWSRTGGKDLVEADMKNFGFSDNNGFSGYYRIEAVNNGYSITSRDAAVGKVPIENLHGDITVLGNDFTLDLSANQVNLQGYYAAETEDEGATLELSTKLTDVLLDKLYELSKLFTNYGDLSSEAQKIAENSIVNATVFISTDLAQRFTYNCSDFDLKLNDIADVSLSFSGNQSYFEVIEGDVLFGKGEKVELSGRADFANTTSIAANINYGESAYNLNGTFGNDGAFQFEGSYGLFGTIIPSASGGISGYIQTENFPLPILGDDINASLPRLDCEVNVSANNFSDWFFDINRFTLYGLEVASTKPLNIDLKGRLDTHSIDLHNLSIASDGYESISGSLLLDYAEQDTESLQLNVSLQDSSGNEALQIDAKRNADSSIEAKVDAGQFRLDRFVKTMGLSTVTTNATIHWKDEKDFSLVANGINYREAASAGRQALGFSGNVVLNQDSFIADTVTVSYAEMQSSIARIELYRNEAIINLINAHFTTPMMASRLAFDFTGSGRLASFASWSEFSEALNDVEAELLVRNAAFSTLQADKSFRISFNKHNDSISVQGGPDNVLTFLREGDGQFTGELKQPSYIRGAAHGYIDLNSIDAEVSNFELENELIRLLLPDTSPVIFTGGYYHADLVRVLGALGDPILNADTVIAHDFSMNLPLFLQSALGPVSFAGRMQDNELSINPVTVPVGSGAGLVSGTLNFSRWVPEIINLDISAAEATALPAQFSVNGIIARGEAWGDLQFNMSSDEIQTGGELWLQNTDINLDLDTLSTSMSKEKQMSGRTLSTDFRIHSGRHVSFTYPNEDMPVIQATAALGNTLLVRFDEASGALRLIGDIRLLSGEIYYFQRSFFIRSGTLSFNETELQVNPRLSVRAEMRDIFEGQTVIISMIADNAPLFNLQPRFESNPALSQVEILSLMGQSVMGS
ncbi:MAG: translocation/assembly module TamB domain-containing protein, partial [Spirochaetaceae bacterium]|nr:translocation/assembly module TamB domain-containing protein [Spirochaetaceae bacterium]